jgi:uncharacterized YigZ family protein
MDKNLPIYKTISKPSEGLYKDKGSKFISYAYPVSTEEEVKDALEAVKKSHHAARHHCYAYRINPRDIYERANDDGEPRHSAGTPILGQLQSFQVVNTLVVVVRYFGGTKLGVSGLINAYKTAAADALTNADRVEKELKAAIEIRFDYAQMNDVMRIIKQFDAIIIKQEMQLNVQMNLEIREDRLLLIQEQLGLVKKLTFNPL